MKIAELRKLTKKQLLDQLKEARLELMKLEAKKALKTLEKPSQVRNTRRLIARIETLLKEKALKAEKPKTPKKKVKKYKKATKSAKAEKAKTNKAVGRGKK